MHIVIFGAAGPTGRQLTDQALAAGHRVVAVTRRPARLPSRDGLTVVGADVADSGALDAVIAGSDAVLSVLGVPLSRAPVNVYSLGVANIIAAMDRHAVRRLVVVSSSVTDPAWRPSGAFFFNHVLDPMVNRVLGKTVHEDMRRMETLIQASDLDWTIVRACGLFDHPEVTNYQLAESSADGLFTARGDLAASMLAQLTDDRFVRKAMGVITTDVKPGIIALIWREVIKKNARFGGLGRVKEITVRRIMG